MSQTEKPGAPRSVRLSDDVVMEFRWIPAGSFVMGARGEYEDEEPRHLVKITCGFYLGTHPVTQEQFAVWTKDQTPPDGPHENHFTGRPRHPAENLSWNDALAFCAWLNEARPFGLPEGYTATLPTEAEWEYACRAVTVASLLGERTIASSDTEYHSGDGAAALDDAGWYEGNFRGETHPVGQKAANGVGLHDMHGNVDEWCWDEYDTDAYRTRVDGVADPGSRKAQPIGPER